jgi:hypothetical protein
MKNDEKKNFILHVPKKLELIFIKKLESKPFQNKNKNLTLKCLSPTR